MSRVRAFLSEARRRKVYLAGAAYVAIGVVIIQIVGPIAESLMLPEWTPRLVIFLVILGLPVVLVLAWVFDLDREGVRRTQPMLGRRADRATGTMDSRPPASPGASTRPPVSALHVGSPLPAPPTRARRTPVAAVDEASSPTPESDAAAARKAEVAHLRHELRTPINGIMGYSEMVLEDVDDPEIVDKVNELVALGNQLLGVVDREMGAAAAGDESGPGVAELASRVQERIREPVTRVLAGADALAARARSRAETEPLAPDLERIAAAARRLQDTAERAARPEAGPDGEGGTDGVAGGRRSPQLTREVLSKLRPARTHRRDAHPGGGGRILVVDDNPQNRDLLSRSLARAGYMVATAEDGADALQRLGEQSFDVVLLDLIMPGMDGLEALRRIRDDEALQEIPVVMLSSLDEVDSVVRCIEMGAEEYLVKPVQPPILEARIAANVELRRMRTLGHGYLERLQADEEFIARVLGGAFPSRFARRLQRGDLESEERYPETTALCVLIGCPDLSLEKLRPLFASTEAVARDLGVELCLWGPGRFVALSDPEVDAGEHAVRMAELSLALLEDCAGAANGLSLRLGLHTGSAGAGILGRDRFRFDMWGEAPDVAAQAARAAPSGGALVTAAVIPFLGAGFRLEARGVAEFGGHGRTTVHRLVGRSH